MHTSKNMRRQRLAVRLFVSLLLAPMFALLLLASPAGAATGGTSSNGVQTSLICGSSQLAPTATADNLLPVNRWSGAIGEQHTRLPGGLLSGITNAPDSIDRSVFVGGMTSIGAAEWQLGVATTEAASQFCFASAVGSDANKMAASLGNAIQNSGLVAIFVVVALLGGLWRVSRGRENPMRQVIKVVLVVGVFTAMVSAATSGSSDPSSAPPPLSPAWFVTSAYAAVSNLSSAPAVALANASNATVGGGGQSTISTSDPLDCSWYTQELVAQYENAYTQDFNQYGYVVPESLNSLWEQAALPAYVSEQFGDGNDYGPLVYCHLLEDQTGTSPLTQMQIAKASGALSGDSNLASFGTTQSSALAWNGAVTNDNEDESLVAWAACQSPKGAGFTPSEWSLVSGEPVTSAWTSITNSGSASGGGSTVTPGDCATFWTADATGAAAVGTNWTKNAGTATVNADYSTFNFGDNPSTIAFDTNTNVNSTNATSGQEIANFLGNLHGISNAGAEATSFIFLLSSTVIMIVFLILGLAVIIAKLGLLLAVMTLPFMLLLALLPGGASNKFTAFLKHMFGMILFATLAGVLLSFIAVITGLLSDIGTAAWGQGSIFALVWTGISPVSAIWICHKFFTKILKAPSPFKPSSALGYGAALGGFGGGLAGADLFSHLRNRGGQAVSMARGRMGGKQGKSGPGQRGRGKQSMGGSGGGGGGQSGAGSSGVGPTGTSPSGVGAVAAGAPVGAATGAVSQSMFKKDRRQRRVETEQYSADKWAAGERVSQRTSKLEKAKGSLVNPGFAAGAAVGGAQQRVKESIDRTKKLFNQKRDGDTHRIQGSMLTAAAAGAAAGRGILKVPKVAKYGAMGIGGVAALGLGAPVLGAVGAAYGAKKLRDFSRNAPIRQAQNLASFRQYQVEQDQAAKAARDAQADAASTAETERQAAETKTAEQQAREQAEREQAERERLAQERRVRDWQRGVVGPTSDGPQGPQHNDGPSGPR
jgi:hypothetical protein